ncbi:hypothetical protein I4U23_009053 [Adineta vaga]|nr:hypothetical protein I4U23_009053 [Adineta vaga]
MKKWCIPLITALSIIGVLSLLALGIAIYTLITLIQEQTTTTTTTSLTTTVITLTWNVSVNTVTGTSGVSGTAANQLNSPFVLLIDSLNTLCIADTGNNRIQKQALNAWTDTTIAGQINGVSGSTTNQLTSATGVAVDSAGNVYVADTATSGSTIAGMTNTVGNSLSHLNTPYGITRNPLTGIVYVADTMNHRIVSFSPPSSTGPLVAGGNGQELSTSQLHTPTGLYFDSSTNTLDASCNVYVADTQNHRIQLFLSGQSSGATIVDTTEVSDSSLILLNEPVSIVLDQQINLYAADKNNHRIQKFDKI